MCQQKIINEMSDFFSCKGDLMQGKSISPFLFSIFVSEWFHNGIYRKMCKPGEVRDSALFFIMYTDDAVLFSETE